jgi:O-antigen ligase
VRRLRWPFLAVLVLAPLPLGGNRPVPWTLLALAVAALLLGWSVSAALPRARSVMAPERLWPALGGLSLVVLVALLQMAPLAPRPWQHPLWLQASAVLGDAAAGRISVNPYETGTALMRLLSYAGVFWLALQFSRQPHGARRIVQAIALAGLVYAAYGLSVFVLDLNLVLWWHKWTWMTGVTSSFVNRNSYATYAGLGLLCTVGLLITSVYRDFRSLRFRLLPWRVRLMRITWRGWWLVGAVILLALALLLTRSRAGVASSAAGLAVLVASFGATRLMRQRDVLITGGLALLLALVVFAFGGDDLVDRFERRGMESEVRFTAYQKTVGAIGDAPWLGTGYGTFPEVFRSYQSGVSDAFWNHAHNTYLENALELGLPATALLVGSIGWLAYVCAHSLRRRRARALYPCLGVAATTLVGLHSLLDFSLEIPAVAVTYAAIMGVAFGHARRSVGTRRRAISWRGRPQWQAAGLAAVAALGILSLALPRLVAELTGLPARLVVRQLDAGLAPPIGALDRAIAAGRAAAAWADAGQNWTLVARAELALAERPGVLPPARRSRLERADLALRQALAHAPADPVTWAQLAYVTLLRDGDPADINGALTLSVLTGPSLGTVMTLRSGTAALAWERLDPRTRALFEAQFVKTMQFAPQQFVEAIRRSEGVTVVRAQLESDPPLEREFERLLLILGQR